MWLPLWWMPTIFFGYFNRRMVGVDWLPVVGLSVSYCWQMYAAGQWESVFLAS
jgi:hypothetical protein